MALRKLQAEIDRTLKSVATGVEVFEGTFDKLNHATNTTQKDKLENDLKTQIKKLQRMRDQIKAWLGNGDIKDKTQLLENRRLIETQMERFKALEKETKMKAFSKEGLIAQSRLDPAEKAKRDVIDWIGSTTDELSRQIEQTEAEAETLQATKKKKQSSERLEELEELNERREWHIGRLEIVQRMLENGQLGVSDVEDIQEDVKYFVEANMEEDFDFDNGIYDELNLQDLEEDYHDFTHDHAEQTPLSPSPEPIAKTPAKTPAPDKITPAKGRSASHTSQPETEEPSSPITKKTPLKKTTMDKEKKEKEKEEKKKEEKEKKEREREREEREKEKEEREKSSTAPTPAKPVSLPPIRYAAAAAAAVSGSSSVPVGHVAAPIHESPKEEKQEPQPQLSSLPPPPPGLYSTPSQGPQTQQPQQPQQPLAPVPTPAPAQSEHAPSISAPSDNAATTASLAHSQTPALQAQQPSQQQYIQQQQPPQPPQPSQPSQPSQPQPQQQEAGVMGNLMQSFEVAKEISKRRGEDGGDLQLALEGSFANVPQQIDAEPPRYYHPKNPIKTPSHYPQSPLPLLASPSPALFARLDLDQLFYIFYYMTGTYHQWLAARELKKQSWRFHKQYLTWFQRAHNPQAITGDYEQGGYYYFDWENSWCQRRKSDFRFEYRWLSDH
ncbi:uncharacterized protein L203_106377 [Cryptococcus depauperatus CBS 7841]|uniref:General negative regulator of transcription subunit n=1 Tax=Cryptococcus depauperatus CBS 7841 TaxID=1295531 RepID=A0A1E3ILN8_9TREE|nr:CCR4-NOT transcription complex subunit 3 [Cryptococcus depauperatus CBS 7841]